MSSKRVAIALASTVGMLSLGVSGSSAHTPAEKPTLEGRSERLTILEGAGAAVPEAIARRHPGEPKGDPGRVPWTVCRPTRSPECSIGPSPSIGIGRKGDGILEEAVGGRAAARLWRRDR
jgi:hypothetical protein